MNYVETTYTNIPQTNYPQQLIKYLTNRFNIQEQSKILDLGCGRGLFGNAFEFNGQYVVYCDRKNALLNQKIIKFTEDLNWIHIYPEFIEQDLEKPFGDIPARKFDVIFCKSVLEHINNQEQFMNECYRILKPNGKLIVLVPDWNSQKISFIMIPHIFTPIQNIPYMIY